MVENYTSGLTIFAYYLVEIGIVKDTFPRLAEDNP